MYIVYDSITGDNIGPFFSFDDAQMFLLEADDLVTNLGQAELEIQQVFEAQEWAMNNAVDMADIL
jgi:hypothetical protein